MKKHFPKIASALTAMGLFAAFITFTLSSGFNPVPVDTLLPALAAANTMGDQVYAEMQIHDGTGVVTTAADGGVLTAITTAPLVLGDTDGSGCITGAVATGLFTVNKKCGVGMLELTACISKAAGSSNTGCSSIGNWVKNGADLTTGLTTSPQIFQPQVADAGNTYGNFGCSTVLDSSTLGDTYGFYVSSSGCSTVVATVTSKQASFRVQKISSN